MDNWDQEDQMRRGDQYNEELIKRLRHQGLPEKEIDKFMSPLDRGEDDKAN